MSGAIDPHQIRLIHIAKGQLGMDDGEYRELLITRYVGCFTGSCKELTYEEASDLIDHMRTLGFVVRPKGRGRAKRAPGSVSLITPAQRGMIKRLAGEIEWKLSDGLSRYSKKIIGKERPATSREASRLIEALKGLTSSQQRAAR